MNEQLIKELTQHLRIMSREGRIEFTSSTWCDDFETALNKIDIQAALSTPTITDQELEAMAEKEFPYGKTNPDSFIFKQDTKRAAYIAGMKHILSLLNKTT